MTPNRAAIRDAFLARAAKERLVMGVLNVTPDSFSDGGQYFSPTSAVTQARRMLAAGADIVDIGGESTRPSATPVGETDEIERISDVIEALSAEGNCPISVDTYKAATARAASAAGAVVVNDISGLTFDPGMADAIAETESAVVITYNRRKTESDLDIRADMLGFLETAFDRARAAGIPENRILTDPGIGFAKTYEQNLTLIANLKELVALGRPVLVGLSRKSFIGLTLDRSVDARLAGTLATNLYALQAGAAIVRVHDVSEHVDAIRMLNALETRRWPIT